jgi:hypothetical protein
MAAIAAQMIEFLASIFMMRCRSCVEGQRAATQIVRGSAQALVCTSEGTSFHEATKFVAIQGATRIIISHHLCTSDLPPLPHVCGLQERNLLLTEKMLAKSEGKQMKAKGRRVKVRARSGAYQPRPSCSLLTIVLYHVCVVSCRVVRAWMMR